MINKPEDAEPRDMIDDATDAPIYYFTASECAEIARAYAGVFSGATASELPYPSVMKAISEAKETREQWEAKFKEWEQS